MIITSQYELICLYLLFGTTIGLLLVRIFDSND
jgi:hypothetical protein